LLGEKAGKTCLTGRREEDAAGLPEGEGRTGLPRGGLVELREEKNHAGGAEQQKGGRVKAGHRKWAGMVL